MGFDHKTLFALRAHCGRDARGPSEREMPLIIKLTHYRLTFLFAGGDADDVNFEDYH